MIKTAEMRVENEENKKLENLTIAQENAPAQYVEFNDNFSSELAQPIWSVVSYEAVAVSSLNYDEAVKWIEKLKAKIFQGCAL